MVLVFDVSSDLAMFRKSYTTTSAVSFPFPPPTALAGLIGAICGLKHGSNSSASSARFWKEMSGMRVAVGIKRPIRWFTTAVNLMKFKTPNASMGEHIQVKHQFAKMPKYRVYVEGDTEVYRTLRKCLKEGRFVYTPYLGLAFCIADVEFLGEFETEPVFFEENSRINIDTVLPDYGEVEVDVLATGGVHREVVPFRMDENRRLEETVTVFYPHVSQESSCRLVLSKQGQVDITAVGSEKVAWFRPW